MADAPDGLTRALEDRYAIEREIGAGGMATVYLAADLKHPRRVAIKVLRSEIAAVVGAERFVQEIRVTAGLQHPHILGLIDSGIAETERGPLPYYVMPYVDGESLRQKLQRETQLPIEEALTITTAVASALDYAHRHGVIHRDIKPENILLHEGQALVADFGIALALESAGGTRLTETGLALGTPQYMSPEQGLAAREIGPRSDVYALGCVVYEMLAGEPPFTGPTVQAIIAKAARDTPQPLRVGRPSVPASVDMAVHRALEKLPPDRFATAGQLAAALTQPEVVVAESETPVGSSSSRRRDLGIGIVLGGLIVGAVSAALFAGRRSADGPVVRLTISLPRGQRLHPLYRQLAISNGRWLAYIAIENDTSRLYLRALDRFESRRVPAGEGADFAFFSPDGKWIGFFVDRTLFKAPLAGGGAIQLGTMARTDRQWTFDGGAAWASDGRIYVGQKARGLWAIPPEGGVPTQVTFPDSSREHGHTWPAVVHNGRILFTTYGLIGDAHGAILNPGNGNVAALGPEGAAHFQPCDTGYLIYNVGDELRAAPFDLDRRVSTGPGIRILEDATNWSLSLSQSAAAYTADPVDDLRRVVWLDRAGRAESVMELRPGARFPRLSPDGRRLTLETEDGSAIVDLRTRTRIALGRLQQPGWTSDGRRIVYVDSLGHLASRAGDGSGTGAQVYGGPAGVAATSFSPDGKWLAFTKFGGADGGDIVVLDQSGKPLGGISGPGSQWNATFSPDGRWLAYQSNESGRWDIYVQSVPALDEKHSISPDGGTEPVWSHDGRELFFRSGDRMMMAPIQAGPTFAAEQPRVLFRSLLRYVVSQYPGWNYDVAPDGRFLMIERGGDPEIRVVLNFGVELRRLAPR